MTIQNAQTAAYLARLYEHASGVSKRSRVLCTPVKYDTTDAKAEADITISRCSGVLLHRKTSADACGRQQYDKMYHHPREVIFINTKSSRGPLHASQCIKRCPRKRCVTESCSLPGYSLKKTAASTPACQQTKLVDIPTKPDTKMSSDRFVVIRFAPIRTEETRW
jgi:hypothetical protein